MSPRPAGDPDVTAVEDSSIGDSAGTSTSTEGAAASSAVCGCIWMVSVKAGGGGTGTRISAYMCTIPLGRAQRELCQHERREGEKRGRGKYN